VTFADSPPGEQAAKRAQSSGSFGAPFAQATFFSSKSMPFSSSATCGLWAKGHMARVFCQSTIFSEAMARTKTEQNLEKKQ